MHYLPIVSAVVLLCCAAGQAAEKGLSGDRVSTDEGDLIIHPVHHATLVMQWKCPFGELHLQSCWLICQDWAIATHIQETSDGQTIRDPGREAFWRQTLAIFRKSGLSVREFCRREKLHESAFSAWRRTVKGRPRQRGRKPPAFVPLVLSSPRGGEHHAPTSRRSPPPERIVSGRPPCRSGTRPGGGGEPAMIGATRGRRAGKSGSPPRRSNPKSFDGLAEVLRPSSVTIRWAATSSSFATAPASSRLFGVRRRPDHLLQAARTRHVPLSQKRPAHRRR